MLVNNTSNPSRDRVPLLRDSFIDTDMGNPTVLRIQLVGNRRILRPGRRRSIFSAFIKGHRPALPLHACFFLESYYLEFQRPGFNRRKPQQDWFSNAAAKKASAELKAEQAAGREDEDKISTMTL